MKKIFIYLLMLVALFTIAGCGDPADGPNNGGNEGGEETPGGNEGGEETPGGEENPNKPNNGSIADDSYTIETVENLLAQPDGSVEVVFRIPFGTTIQNVLNEFVDEFEAEYPSVNIELEVVSGYDDMKKATIQDINGGVVPTMTVGYPDHFAEYLITKSIISLDKFIESEEVGYSEEEISDFLPGYIAENRQFDNVGSYVGLPLNKSTEALYYNKDFFEEFNLDVPQTWADMEQLFIDVENIVADIEDGTYPWLGKIQTNLANNEFIPCLYDSGGNMFTTIIHQFGGEYTESIYKANGLVDVQRGTLKFNTSPEAIQGITYLQTLANSGNFNLPDAYEKQYGSELFNAGKALMNIGSTGGSSYYAEAICNMGVAPIPYKDADHKYVIQQGTNVCIMSQASDLEKLAAWLFIKHMLTPENTAEFAIVTGYMPVRSSAYELQDYIDFLEGPTTAAQVHKATSQYAKEGWNFFVDAAWSGSSNVRTECELAMKQILVDKTTVSQALEDAVGRIG